MCRYFILLIVLVSCTKEKITPNYNVLAKVGDRIITDQDFIRRAEYTIRPDYCKGNLYIHKKIILNNLIAEKLLAIEAMPLFDKQDFPSFQNFIKGRKEQSMRQLLYYDKGYSKAEIDNNELDYYYKKAGRIFEVEYFSYPEGEFADSLISAINDGFSLKEIYQATINDSIPTREVGWFDPNNEIVNQALFLNDPQKGQIIGPARLDDGSNFIMQVKGWTDQIDLSETGGNERLEKVIRTLKERRANDIFKKYIMDVMSGKKIQLNQNVFIEYANSVSDHFFTTKDDKESAIADALFKGSEFLEISDIKPLDKRFQPLNLFSINGDSWTVNDFEIALKSHPLVFRKKRMSPSEFSQQFKMAIVDFVQDHFLTLKAYELNMHENNIVKLNESLWVDSFMAYQSAKILMAGKSDDSSQPILMKPIIDDLQKKYNNEIFINMKLFESIQISNVDMFVTQGNVPYPIVVPQFPSYTNDNVLDYGSTIN